jgi:two-component system sensor histidine kinase QseC
MNTIRGRLLALLLIGLTAVLAVGGFAVHWIAGASLLHQLDDSLRTRAESLAALVTVEPNGIVFDPEGLWAHSMADAGYEFRTSDGLRLHHSGSAVIPDRPPPTAEDNAHRNTRCVFADIELENRAPGRAVWMTFQPRIEDEVDDEADETDVDPHEIVLAPVELPPPEMTVMVAASRRSVDEALASLLRTLIAVGAALALTVALLVMLGVRWGLGPLDRLGKQLQGVSGETISTRIAHDDAPRELAPICEELNRMLDRVEQTLQRERAFASAAAHELRTPLAELRTTAEVAMRWPDADRATTALHDALAIGREMEALVESLLHISRGTAVAAAGCAVAPVEIEPILRACVERAHNDIVLRQLHVRVDVPAGTTISAPRDVLELIARNLIDNAVHYTPVDGSITISATRFAGAAGGTALVVENRPVDLTQADLPHLFEPFWRSDAARGDRAHVGLGLAVVRHVAEAAALQVEATLDGDRLRLTVSRATTSA